MGLGWFGLWTLGWLLSSAVKAEVSLHCAAPDLQNGFFVAQQNMAHNTDLYYGCDEKFKTIAGTWWASVTCKNGAWSTEPKCIPENDLSSCIDPKIPNAIYPAFKYKPHNELLRVKGCQPGFEKQSNHPAQCNNGEWINLPICTKMATWCDPPPVLLNAVVVNLENEDVFQENTEAIYKCVSGFQLEPNKRVVCQNGKWTQPYPSCRQKTARRPTVNTATSTSSGSGNNNQPAVPTAQVCPKPDIQNGLINSQQDTFSHDAVLSYSCNKGFKQAKGPVTCQHGAWSSSPLCIDDSACFDPKIPNAIYPEFIYKLHNDLLRIDCELGYEKQSTRPAVCNNGEWTNLPKCTTSSTSSGSGNNYEPVISTTDQCPPIPDVENGMWTAESDTSLRYECKRLYRLKGSSSVRCILGQWSPVPTCEENFCLLDTSSYRNLENKREFMESGTDTYVSCGRDQWVRAVCTRNTQLYLSDCCQGSTFSSNRCRYHTVSPSQ